ncbi:MAG: tRNA dihydrouridine synthase DusB [Clostridia bacterium]|nr:tRNA dihydrouridine synthase DusB [Clostridia bacterium]
MPYPFGAQYPILLAPMAGVTDVAFRELCVAFGADMTYTEMVSAKGLHYNNRNSRALLRISDVEKPCAIQLFGSEPEIMADIARALCDDMGDSLRLIDINMGCPAPKITRNGEGCALMLDPGLAARIVGAVAAAASVPVTVKHRLGFDSSHVNGLEFARVCRDAGAAAVTVHARTRAQMYSGRADYDAIARIAAALDIPVIGNGDVFDGESALRMRSTGCAGIMVARGAQGNPFIFAEIRAALRGEAYSPPSWERRREVALAHIRRHVQLKGEGSFAELRKHLSWYTRGIDGSAAARVRINAASSSAELVAILEKIQ